jgi:hypothetical protein
MYEGGFSDDCRETLEPLIAQRSRECSPVPGTFLSVLTCACVFSFCVPGKKAVASRLVAGNAWLQ